jgi:hypothetical protein
MQSAVVPAHRARALASPPWLIAAALAAVYLAVQPPSADLAAATYRSDLFARVGFTLWDNGWYAGHNLLAYSLLAPALGALLGPRLLMALAAVAASALFAPLARAGFGREGGAVAGAWFAAGVAVGLLSGRVPYYLGLAVGLGALVALHNGRRTLGLVLAASTSLASPVAGGFLALAGGALALSGEHRRSGLWLVVAALLPILALSVAFPEGGHEPFAAGSFWPGLAGIVLVALLLPGEQRVLRTGVVLYGLLWLLAYAFPTPLGGNVARLGALLAGPLVAGALWGSRQLALAVVAPLLLYWQLVTPLRDLSLVAGDPSVHASYYAPLLAELERITGGHPVRLEVPLTGAHWEAADVPPQVSLARGWERQLDTRFAALFYGRGPTPDAYRAWLADNAIAYVAIPDVRLDAAGQAERKLIAGGLPFLHELWQSRDWRLYGVRPAAPLAQPPATLVSLGADDFELLAPRRGTFTVRVRFTPYWALRSGHGCVAQAQGGWTEVRAAATGRIAIGIDFSPGRIFDNGPRCR